MYIVFAKTAILPCISWQDKALWLLNLTRFVYQGNEIHDQKTSAFENRALSRLVYHVIPKLVLILQELTRLVYQPWLVDVDFCDIGKDSRDAWQATFWCFGNGRQNNPDFVPAILPANVACALVGMQTFYKLAAVRLHVYPD